MKHIASENRILISLDELVSIARRRISPTLPTDECEPELSGASRATLTSLGIPARQKVSLDYTHGGIDYRIFGYAESIENGEITLVKSVTGNTKGAKKAEVAQARGEGFILGKIIAENESRDEITLKVIYVNEISGASDISEEKIDKKAIDSFFEKCADAVSIFAIPEIERVTEFLPITSSPTAKPRSRSGCSTSM